MLRSIVCLMILMSVSSVEADMSESRLIAETISRESSGNFDEMVAIGKVLRNRKDTGWYGDSYISVILSKSQFSCWNEGTIQEERTKEQLDNAALAFELSSLKSDFPANLYHLADMKKYPSWTKANNVKRLCQVGAHIFYEERR